MYLTFRASWAVLLLLRLPARVLAVADVVDLGYAKYQGIPSGENVKAWLGIRYAAPPLGALRFAAPADPPAVVDVQLADKYGPKCLETGTNYARSLRDGASEDCLFTDVYAPTNATNLPVYIFLQGGGFNSNANANINATGFIQASGLNMVVVTFNYRVGPYGFLASREIVAGGSTNNGLKDQRKVFQWVQKYISQFGGDPAHVVIGGASAGGASVTLHLTAYGGRNDNLFHGGAAESQSFGTTLTVPESQYIYDALTSRTNCVGSTDTLACLRQLSSSQLQDHNINIPFPNATYPPLYLYGPVLDGDIIPDYPIALYARGAIIPVPTIYGDDTNEGTVFVPRSTASQNDSDLFLTTQFPALTPADLTWVHAHYPEGNTTFPGAGAYWRQASNVYGEMRYICPGINISTQHAARLNGLPQQQQQRVWNYRWNVLDPDDEASGRGVPHTAELAAIWGRRDPPFTGLPVPNGGPKSYAAENREIIPLVQGYWTSFIRALDPNVYRAPGAPEWAAWGKIRDGEGVGQRIRFQTNGTVMEAVQGGLAERCEYWGRAAVRLRQ